MATTTLTERRKADRLKMAAGIQALAEKYGATLVRTDTGPDIVMNLRLPGGLCASIWLESRSIQPDVHVVAWNLLGHGVKEGRRISPAFGEVNPHHGLKATQVARGWEGLQANLQRAFDMEARGELYVDKVAA